MNLNTVLKPKAEAKLGLPDGLLFKSYLAFIILTMLAACTSTPTLSNRSDLSPKKDDVSEAIHSIRDYLIQCYRQAQRTNKDLHGLVYITWTVDQKGNATKVEGQKTPPEMSALVDCTADRVKRTHFPPALKGTYYEVNYPFLFGEK